MVGFSVSYYWLVLGVICIAVEALGLSGVGFFFAGLASICVAVLAEAGLVGQSSYLAQFAWFFALTAVWAAILWKPIRRYYTLKKHSGGFSNIVGDTAIVTGDGLVKGKEGTVIWSGTIMKAEITPGAHIEHAGTGGQVIIVDVKGAKLIVEPK